MRLDHAYKNRTFYKFYKGFFYQLLNPLKWERIGYFGLSVGVTVLAIYHTGIV